MGSQTKVKSGLVVEALPDGGCLIVDEAESRSHALRAEAATVWHALERGTDPTDLVSVTKLGREIVEAALAELEGAGLVEVEQAGSSRREWLARAATVAGAAAGLKLVETIATPSPAAAQTGTDSSDGPPV
jgi:DNA-binding transcriptional ArsR family regulator